MKKITITLFAALAIGLVTTSCSKDDNNSSQVQAPTLLGKWYYSQEGTTDGTNEELVPYSGNESGCEKDYVLLNPDNTFVDVDFDSTDSPCQKTEDVASYAVNGNTIIVDFGDGPQSATIMSMTLTQLKVKTADNYIQVFTR